nr:1999_t:CDS:2 [Entrophospora candida]
MLTLIWALEGVMLVDHDPDSGDNNNTDDENLNSMDIDSDAEETLLFESNENNDYSSAIKKRAKEFMKLYSQWYGGSRKNRPKALYNLTIVIKEFGYHQIFEGPTIEVKQIRKVINVLIRSKTIIEKIAGYIVRQLFWGCKK